MSGEGCPFCAIPEVRIFVRNDLCFATWDINPVSKGHTLLIPFRHVSGFFDTTPDEQRALLDLAARTRAELDRRYHPAGYNLGVNIGRVAGQVVDHVHLHLIPRYPGDAHGQGSGMRHVIPRPKETQVKLSGFLPKQRKGKEEGVKED